MAADVITQTGDAPHRILVVGPAWVGDMIMAQSLFMILKQRQPQVIIDVVAPKWSQPLLSRMAQVNCAYSLPVSHGELQIRARWLLGRRLRFNGYSQAIVVPRSFKAALLPFFAKIPRRTGYKGEMRYGLINDLRPLDKTILTQTVQRYVSLGLPPGEASLPPHIPQPQLTVDNQNRERILGNLGLNTDKKIVAILPGAEYGLAKRWPPQRYRALAERLSNAGNQVWVFGSEKERSLGEQVAAGLSASVINLCGKTALQDAIDLLSLVTVAVTNDSGLMHVAAAVGINIVAIYGSSTPAYTPPLTAKARVLYENLSCSPCFKRQCPLKHTLCLNNIDVEQVIQEVIKILAATAENQ